MWSTAQEHIKIFGFDVHVGFEGFDGSVGYGKTVFVGMVMC